MPLTVQNLDGLSDKDSRLGEALQGIQDYVNRNVTQVAGNRVPPPPSLLVGTLPQTSTAVVPAQQPPPSQIANDSGGAGGGGDQKGTRGTVL